MSDFNQPAYPTTLEHHGYSPDFETRRYSSSGLTMLQRVASEQLAALIPTYYGRSCDLPLTDEDVIPDESGRLYRDDRGKYEYADPRYGNRLPPQRYSIIATEHQRLARQAVKYAKALLEITQ